MIEAADGPLEWLSGFEALVGYPGVEGSDCVDLRHYSRRWQMFPGGVGSSFVWLGSADGQQALRQFHDDPGIGLGFAW